MGCFLCESNENLLIKKYKHWTVIIHPNQFYLGRCMVKLNRHIIDLCETKQKEREELFEVLVKLRDALKELFSPDLFNYALLGNVVNHLHVHFIPRYKEERKFKGIRFLDERWGKNYAPYNREFKIPISVLNELRGLIKQKLQ